MNSMLNLIIYLCFGLFGGLCGLKLKIPGGVLMGALLAVILAKIAFKFNVEMPKSFTFAFQMFLGVMIGSSFQPEMIKMFGKIAIPVIISTIILVGSGIVLSVILTRLGIVDIGTAYLGTSPGAMSAIIVLALDSGSDSLLVTCFHFFRIVFIIVTTPFIFRFFLD
jgi:membrane AbrB-like protein